MSNIEITEEQMRTLIETALPLVKRHNPLEDINLFTILGMETKEVSAHSAFLYYIFKPFKGKDAKRDDNNLRILYRQLKNKINNETDDMPNFLDIQREVAFDGGRLDFLLLFDSDAAVIELKVWAGEQPYQIQRYREFLKQNGYSEENVFFLTPNGRTATTGDAQSISLKEDISAVLEKICEERVRYTQYVSIVKQYLSLIKKLTGDDATMPENNIFKSKNDILAVDILLSQQQAVLTKILSQFMCELQEKLIVIFGNLDIPSNSGKRFSHVKDAMLVNCNTDNYYVAGIRCYPAIVFSLDKEALKTEYKKVLSDGQEIYFFVEIDNNLYSGITVRNRDKILDVVNLDKAFENDLFSNKKQENKALHPFAGAFWSWEYVKYNGHLLNFKDYGSSDRLFSILKEDSLEFIDRSIDDIAAAVFESFKRQYNFIFEQDIL